jgi:nucleoid DNA-binding protein
MAKTAVPKKPLTKTELITNLATATELSKKQIIAVMESLASEIQKALSNKGAGLITIPGLLKIEKKHVPAKAAQKNVLNRFTGEYRDVPAKPASSKVKLRALKTLKEWAK